MPQMAFYRFTNNNFLRVILTHIQFIYTSEETTRLYVKKKLDLAILNSMEDWGPEENVFWKALTEHCLKPSSDAFGHNENLQGRTNLYNYVYNMSNPISGVYLYIVEIN